jgi:hypothetical protein
LVTVQRCRPIWSERSALAGFLRVIGVPLVRTIQTRGLKASHGSGHSLDFFVAPTWEEEEEERVAGRGRGEVGVGLWRRRMACASRCREAVEKGMIPSVALG